MFTGIDFDWMIKKSELYAGWYNDADAVFNNFTYDTYGRPTEIITSTGPTSRLLYSITAYRTTVNDEGEI